MAQKSRQSLAVGGADASNRLQPADEVFKAGPDGDTINCTPAGNRLLRVLVADDSRDTADILSLLVRLWGHDVRPTYGGAEALEMTFAYRPDVLLLDIAMPTMDGCQLAQQLRRQTHFKDTLLIAITGYADQAHRLLCEEAGFDLCLIKPVEPSTLETLLLLEQDRLAESPEASLVPPRKYGVLIVDDEEAVRGALNVVSRQQRFAVWLAADGQRQKDRADSAC